jgi:hypothetical protein
MGHLLCKGSSPFQRVYHKWINTLVIYFLQARDRLGPMSLNAIG